MRLRGGSTSVGCIVCWTYPLTPSLVSLHMTMTVQGLTLSRSEYYLQPVSLLRLWVHECERVFQVRDIVVYISVYDPLFLLISIRTPNRSTERCLWETLKGCTTC
jgi:hypothetical protein